MFFCFLFLCVQITKPAETIPVSPIIIIYFHLKIKWQDPFLKQFCNLILAAAWRPFFVNIPITVESQRSQAIRIESGILTVLISWWVLVGVHWFVGLCNGGSMTGFWRMMYAPLLRAVAAQPAQGPLHIRAKTHMRHWCVPWPALKRVFGFCSFWSFCVSTSSSSQRRFPLLQYLHPAIKWWAPILRKSLFFRELIFAAPWRRLCFNIPITGQR